jgi:hypothetical protein
MLPYFTTEILLQLECLGTAQQDRSIEKEIVKKLTHIRKLLIFSVSECIDMETGRARYSSQGSGKSHPRMAVT